MCQRVFTLNILHQLLCRAFVFERCFPHARRFAVDAFALNNQPLQFGARFGVLGAQGRQGCGGIGGTGGHCGHFTLNVR